MPSFNRNNQTRHYQPNYPTYRTPPLYQPLQQTPRHPFLTITLQHKHHPQTSTNKFYLTHSPTAGDQPQQITEEGIDKYPEDKAEEEEEEGEEDEEDGGEEEEEEEEWELGEEQDEKVSMHWKVHWSDRKPHENRANKYRRKNLAFIKHRNQKMGELGQAVKTQRASNKAARLAECRQKEMNQVWKPNMEMRKEMEQTRYVEREQVKSKSKGKADHPEPRGETEASSELDWMMAHRSRYQKPPNQKLLWEALGMNWAGSDYWSDYWPRKEPAPRTTKTADSLGMGNREIPVDEK